MNINPRIKTTIASFSALGIKFLLPVTLSFFVSDKDFSFLLITYNLLLTVGYIFSFEHHTYYHRKAIHQNDLFKIDFLEKKYFDGTLIIKLIFVIFALIFFRNFTLFQKILIFFVAFLDLHLVENFRKHVAQRNYLKGTLINSARISLPIIIFFGIFFLTKKVNSELIIFATLISFIIIKYLFDIRICNLRKQKLNIQLFLKLSYKTKVYAFISLFGTFIPFLDKLVLLGYQQYNMIQTITMWSIIGNLISLFVNENINKPFQVDLINNIKKQKFNNIIQSIFLTLLILIILFFMTLYLFKFPFQLILKPSINFNGFQILSCVLLTALNPVNGILDISLYGYKKDNIVLSFTLGEFLLKYITTIVTINYFGAFLLPYTLIISNSFYILFKYFYFERVIYRFSR